MSAFVVLSWAASVFTSLLILYVLIQAPHVLVKPSFMVVLFLHCTNQWSSTVLAGQIQDKLTNDWDYFLICQAFPPFALLLSLVFFDVEARRVHERIRAFSFLQLPRSWAGSVRLLVGASSLILVWYLVEVGFSSTGLYAIFFDSTRANIAREQSLKLLQNGGLKYAYSIFSTTLAPVLAILVALSAFIAFKRRNYLSVGFQLVVLAAIVLAVSIYGARAPSAMILLAIVYAFVLRFYSGNPMKWLLPLPVVLFLPALFSALRDQGTVTWEGLAINFLNVADRAFLRGIDDGVAHFQYVDLYGFFGSRGMGNFAPLIAESPVDVFNVVGRKFLFNGIESVSANTTFSIAYYACLGFPALLICTGCLILLDAVTIVYRSIDEDYLLPCVAACQLAASNLASTFFSTIFITYGFGLIPMLCWLLGRRTSERMDAVRITRRVQIV